MTDPEPRPQIADPERIDRLRRDHNAEYERRNPTKASTVSPTADAKASR